MKIKKKAAIMAVMVSAFSISGCAVGPTGRVEMDQQAAVKMLPLGSALFSAVACNQLAKKSSKRDIWTVGCAFAGYSWGANKRNELLSAMQSTVLAAAESGRPRQIDWQASDRSTTAQIVALPVRRGYDRAGNLCREVRMQVRVSDGTYRDEHMEMCRDGGRWVLLQ